MKAPQDYSRPAVMRTELGPALHALGHIIYDQTEAIVMAGDPMQDAIPKRLHIECSKTVATL